MSIACITSCPVVLHHISCITSHQFLHHLDALHHLTSEYSITANPMYYTRCHMYYMGFTFTDVSRQSFQVQNLGWGRRQGGWAMCVLLQRKKQKARPKGVNLKVRWRAKVAMRYCSEKSARRAILVWECRDRPPRRSVGKGACVCACGYDPTPGQGNP